MKKILISFLIISLSAHGYPLGVKAQSGATTYPSKIYVPNSQATSVIGGTLLETGNGNVLINPSLEGTLGAEWTTSATGTLAKTTSAGEFSEGIAGLKVTPAASVFDFSQTVNVTGISQKVVGIDYKVPVTCTTFVLRVYADGSLQTTVPTDKLIKDNSWHTIEVPTVASTSVKINPYANGTCTGDSFFDRAYVKSGIGTQALQLDNVYSAKITVTSGAVANLSKPSWISCTAANPTVCTFAAGIFTVEPNCTSAGVNDTTVVGIFSSKSASGFTLASYLTNTGGYSASQPYNIICTKTGNDYLAASSAVYSQASANTNWAACTFPDLTATSWGGLATSGSITNNLQCRRNNGSVEIRGKFTTGTVGASAGKIPLPTNYGTLTIDSTITANSSAGLLLREVSSTNTIFNILMSASGTYLTHSNYLAGSTNQNPVTGVNGSDAFGNSEVIEIKGILSIPISGWTNPPFAVVPLAGYTNTGEAGTVKTGIVSFGSTSAATSVCSTTNTACGFDQLGSFFNPATSGSTAAVYHGATAGVLTLNFAETMAKVKCTGNVSASGTDGAVVYSSASTALLQCSNCASIEISTRRTLNNAEIDVLGNFSCTGTK